MKSIIKTVKENTVALTFVKRLMNADPEPLSVEGQLLSLLVKEIQIFEKRYKSLSLIEKKKSEFIKKLK